MAPSDSSAALASPFEGRDVAFASAEIHTPTPSHVSEALSDEERALASLHRSEIRRAELLYGRFVAKQALHLLTGKTVTPPVLRGPGGAPRWAPGLTGSISHTRMFAAAAVARTTYVRAIGIDMELANRQLSDRASNRICLPEELRAAGESSDRELAILRIFSAKEALYKAIGPLFEIFLAFEDVRVTTRDDHCFTAQILRARVAGKVIASPYTEEVEIASILTHGVVMSGCMIPIA